MNYALPFIIRPLRPLVPEGRADPDSFPQARELLHLSFGERADEFAGWLAELYWRSCTNVWPAGQVSPGAYRSLTRCRLHGGSPVPVLRLARAVLAKGPARKSPESGEAVFLARPEAGAICFKLLEPVPAWVAALAEGSDAPRFARWLYETGLERALAAETADAGYKVRRLVKKTCEGVDIDREEV